ncbi:MAG: hypothetical protein ABJA20_09330 [Novosphingobium sp.]
MINKTLLANIAAELEALDISAQNARVEALQAELADIGTAIDTAETRCRAIADALAARSGPDAVAIADALLDGATAMAAADVGPGDDAMCAERETLRAGIGELNRRAEAVRREIEDVRNAAQALAIERTQPLADAIAADLRSTAQRLLQGFAAAAALNECTKGHGNVRIAAEQAAAALTGTNKLLVWQRSVEVPAEVSEALGPLLTMGPALPVRRILSAAIVP